MAGNVHKLEIPAAEPHNEDAEQVVLGALIRDNAVFGRLVGSLKPHDFYIEVHADIFRALAALIEAGRRADVVTLTPAIRGKKVGETAAEDYMAELPEAAPNATLEQVLDYVREIARFSGQRAMMAAARGLAQDAGKTEADLAAAYDAAQKRFDEALARVRVKVITAKTAGEFADDAFAEYESSERGIASGLTDIDQRTGGLFAGDYSLVAGRPSMGKTAFAAEVALNVARSGRGVLFSSLEMMGVPVVQRLLSSMTYNRVEDAIHYIKWRTRQLADSEIVRLRNATKILRSYPFVIDQASPMSITQIGAAARRAQDKFGADGKQLGLLVVDYLGLIEASDRYRGSKVAEVGEISGGLKGLAKSLGCHVMALHQLNREVERTDDKRPQLHHLRDSGNLEQDADVVMLVFREEYYVERQSYPNDDDKEAERLAKLERVKNKLQVLMPKLRQGQIGDCTLYCDMAANKIANAADFR